MRILTGRNAVAFVVAMYFLPAAQFALAEPIIYSECSKLKTIGEGLVRIKKQREAIAKGDLHHDGDNDQLCPLFNEQIKYNDELIRVFESDANRCGAGNEAVDRIKTTTEKLRVSASKRCN